MTMADARFFHDLRPLWGLPPSPEHDDATGMRGDLEWRSVPALARSAAERFGDDEALVDDDVRLSFAELWTEATRAARGFRVAGVEPGDRVAIWAPNVWEWPIVLLGAQIAGAVVVPLNTRFKGAEAAYVLDKSRARLLITVERFLGQDYVALLQGHQLPHLERIVVLRPGDPDDPGATPALRSRTVGWSDLLAGEVVASGGAAEPPGAAGADAWLARRLGPTTRATSCSPRARPGPRRAW
jgi:acyl-CoA synthetase (AMP-forming)/AMP-acid ligase II